MSSVNILSGLNITSQIPLDPKTRCINELTLKNLGLNDNLAYTYYKGLTVTCIEERTKYEWKEVSIGEIGLLPSNFIYPNDLMVDGISYSNKEYNFVKVENIAELPPLEKIDEGNGEGIIIRGRNPLNYGNVGLNALDLSYKSSASSTAGATGASSFASGDGTIASGAYSTATGSDTIASGDFSNASNSNTRASGYLSHAEGEDTEASGTTSHAEGQNTLASGNPSHAEGINTVAGGRASHAEGDNNRSLGDSSHSEGKNNLADGDYSHVGGYSNYANSYAEFSIGYFGTYTSGTTNSAVLTDRLINIGNGTSDGARANAFTLLKNGLATLPSVTNALITAASGKAIVTKEYLPTVADNYINDVAAAAGGISIGQMYHTTGTVKIRLS